MGLSNEEKLKVIELVRRSPGDTLTAKMEHSLANGIIDVPRKTVYRWFQDLDSISSAQPKSKHARVSRHLGHLTLKSQVESWMEKTMQFTIKQVASYVRSITGDKFVGKQNALDCWIRRLIKKNGFTRRLAQEKKTLSPSWDTEVVSFVQKVRFHTLTYGDARVWNVDETGLLISHGTKHVYCKKGTVSPEAMSNIKSKTRVTIFIGTSMAGEKMPLSFVLKGEPNPKSRNPKNLAHRYQNDGSVHIQRNAWADARNSTAIFERMKTLMSGRFLWLLDRFEGHRHLPDVLRQSNEYGYRGGSVLFGPAGLTHVWQPADLGIIKMFKHQYRILVQDEAEKSGNPSEYTPTWDVMMRLARNAWNSISRDKIRSCWSSGGYIPNQGTWVGQKKYHSNLDPNTALQEQGFIDVDEAISRFDEPVEDSFIETDTEEEEEEGGEDNIGMMNMMDRMVLTTMGVQEE